MGRIIAIDYGQKRVGVAVTDNLQMIASTLPTVHSKDIFDFITKYLLNEQVDCFVVGEAKQLNNEPSQSAAFIEPFVKQLQTKFPNVPIHRIDERFTSKIASQAILNSGTKKKDRQNKELIDAVSAVIILQSYLEQRDFLKHSL